MKTKALQDFCKNGRKKKEKTLKGDLILPYSDWTTSWIATKHDGGVRTPECSQEPCCPGYLPLVGSPKPYRSRGTGQTSNSVDLNGRRWIKSMMSLGWTGVTVAMTGGGARWWVPGGWNTHGVRLPLGPTSVGGSTWVGCVAAKRVFLGVLTKLAFVTLKSYHQLKSVCKLPFIVTVFLTSGHFFAGHPDWEEHPDFTGQSLHQQDDYSGGTQVTFLP